MNQTVQTPLNDLRERLVNQSQNLNQEQVTSSETTSSSSNTLPPAEQQPQQEAPQPQQPQARAAAAAMPQPVEGEREDDWLSLLHNVVSFLILFSIIYYYSSIERFLVIFTIATILIM